MFLSTFKDWQKSEDFLEPNIAKRIRYLGLTLASFLSTELHVVLYVCYANVMCVHQIRFLKAHWVNASSLCTLAHNPMSLLNWPGWVLVLYFLIDLNSYPYLLGLNIRIRNDPNFFLIRTMALNNVSYWFKWCLLSYECFIKVHPCIVGLRFCSSQSYRCYWAFLLLIFTPLNL